MLVSYLSSRVILNPFTSMEGLLNSPYSLYTEPGTSYWDSFKFGNSLWREIYEKKLEPNEEEYTDFMLTTDTAWKWILQAEERAVYVGYFSLE